MHFNIAGSGPAPVPDPTPVPEPGAPDGSGGPFYVDSAENSLSTLHGAVAVNGSGSKETIRDASRISILTSAGTEVLGMTTTEGTPSASTIPLPESVTTPRPISTAPAGSFVISGAGNGHNVGMSQWGAYAMAKRGYSYKDILNFYYTGIDLH